MCRLTRGVGRDVCSSPHTDYGYDKAVIGHFPTLTETHIDKHTSLWLRETISMHPVLEQGTKPQTEKQREEHFSSLHTMDQTFSHEVKDKRL